MATISTGLRDHIADASFNAQAGIDFDGGVLEIRSGAAPGPDAADGGTLLASITLPTPSFGGASSGAVAKSGTWEDASADATGTAAHFRIKQTGDAGASSTTDERLEGTVTATGGGGDLELDSTSITSGQTVTIDTFTVTMPAS